MEVTSVGPLDGQKIGIIGAGAMGGSLCRGLVVSGAASAANIWASDLHTSHLQTLKDNLGINITSSNQEVVQQADVIVLAVKPFTMDDVLSDIRPGLHDTHLLISIAAGIRIDHIRERLSQPVFLVRAMPNTAAQVLEGACAFCMGQGTTDEHLQITRAIFEAVGGAVQVEERMMDAVTALSGSGPAYVYLMIEALIDGGVKAGLPRDMALKLATQTVLGAAKMVQTTGFHPAQLKDMVATPSGTTIAALASLEQSGFRYALIEAVERAALRSAELGKS